MQLSHTTTNGLVLAFCLIGFSVLGVGVGSVGYLLASTFLEGLCDWSGIQPRLSYGQTAMFIAYPLCCLFGGAIGSALAFVMIRWYAVSAICLVSTSIMGSLIVFGFWVDQVAKYGRDLRSEAVLYYPPLGLCLLALVAMIGVLFVRRRQRYELNDF